MVPLSNVEFGPVDAAAADRGFLSKYVEESNFQALLDRQYSIITGEKGSGKTALIKGLTLKHGEKYNAKININFDYEISYAPVSETLTTIAKTTGIESLKLMVGYWYYVLIVEVMNVVIGQKKTQFSPVESDIYNFLVENKHIEDDVFSRLLKLSSEIWNLIDSATRPGAQQTTRDAFPIAAPSEILSQVLRFPLRSGKFPTLSKHFAEYLKQKKFSVLLTLDGFDLLRRETREDLAKLCLILEGLVAAVYRISTSEQFADTLLIKALLPYDIYLSLELRDRDKYESRYRNIQWDYHSLQEFMRARIELSLNIGRTAPFDHLWYEVMPKTVKNTVLPVEEDSFDYLLRHTLYRPRHLQIHLIKIAERYKGRIITGDMVAEVVRESSRLLVDYFLAERHITHPKLHQFIMHFRGKTNLWDFNSLRRFVAKVLAGMNIADVTAEDKIDDLYRIGFVGLKREMERDTRMTGVYYRYRPPLIGTAEKHYMCDFHVSVRSGPSRRIENRRAFFQVDTSIVSTWRNRWTLLVPQ